MNKKIGDTTGALLQCAAINHYVHKACCRYTAHGSRPLLRIDEFEKQRVCLEQTLATVRG